MVRQTKTPPDSAVTPEQALGTPVSVPEVLRVLQQQQEQQALVSQIGALRQELGSLQGQLKGMETILKKADEDIEKLKRFHNVVLGIGLAITVLIGGLWYVVGTKVSTLLTMADGQQYLEAHPELEHKVELKKPPEDKAT